MTFSETRTALVLRHVAFEDLGSLAPVLAARGYDIRYLEMGQHDLQSVSPQAPDLVVVLGGPIGVYNTGDYPFLLVERDWLRARLAAGKATLGICLGAQLLAAALGAAVFPGKQGKEIGWSELRLSAAAQAYPFMAFLNVPLLHWHGDTFELPSGAVHLASSAQYENQAFAVGDHVLGLQCHPEVTLAGLERWYIGHACEIAATPGLSVGDLRARGRQLAPALEQAASRFWHAWLDHMQRLA